MKHITLYIITILTSLLIGSLATYIIMTKKQMDAVFNTPISYQQDASIPNATQINDNDANESVIDITKKENQENLSQLVNQAQNNEPILNQYSEEQAQKLVNEMPDYVLEQYVDKFLAQDAKDVIQDKRRFAERAIEELYKPNDSQQLVGTAKVSFNYVMPEVSADTSKVNKFAKMYAHLDTHGQIPANQHIFIKWVNNQTGQVLLFEKKNVSIKNKQNWVSFIPDDGWQVGSYDVRFYQFTSELEPIAQTTYHIYEVIDKTK